MVLPSCPSPVVDVLCAHQGNLGHLDAAAGVVGFVALVLALHTATLPPPPPHTAHPDPALRLEVTPFSLGLPCERATPFPPPPTALFRTAATQAVIDAHCRFGAVSSFGVGGTGCHLIAHSSTPRPPPPAEGVPMGTPLQPPCLVRFAAPTRHTCVALMRRCLKYLTADTRLDADVSVADVATALNARHMSCFSARAFFVSDSLANLCEQLRATCAAPATAAKIARNSTPMTDLGAFRFGSGAFVLRLDMSVLLTAADSDNMVPSDDMTWPTGFEPLAVGGGVLSHASSPSAMWRAAVAGAAWCTFWVVATTAPDERADVRIEVGSDACSRAVVLLLCGAAPVAVAAALTTFTLGTASSLAEATSGFALKPTTAFGTPSAHAATFVQVIPGAAPLPPSPLVISLEGCSANSSVSVAIGALWAGARSAIGEACRVAGELWTRGANLPCRLVAMLASPPARGLPPRRVYLPPTLLDGHPHWYTDLTTAVWAEAGDQRACVEAGRVAEEALLPVLDTSRSCNGNIDYASCEEKAAIVVPAESADDCLEVPSADEWMCRVVPPSPTPPSQGRTASAVPTGGVPPLVAEFYFIISAHRFPWLLDHAFAAPGGSRTALLPLALYACLVDLALSALQRAGECPHGSAAVPELRGLAVRAPVALGLHDAIGLRARVDLAAGTVDFTARPASGTGDLLVASCQLAWLARADVTARAAALQRSATALAPAVLLPAPPPPAALGPAFRALAALRVDAAAHIFAARLQAQPATRSSRLAAACICLDGALQALAAAEAAGESKPATEDRLGAGVPWGLARVAAITLPGHPLCLGPLVGLGSECAGSLGRVPASDVAPSDGTSVVVMACGPAGEALAMVEGPLLRAPLRALMHAPHGDTEVGSGSGVAGREDSHIQRGLALTTQPMGSTGPSESKPSLPPPPFFTVAWREFSAVPPEHMPNVMGPTVVLAPQTTKLALWVRGALPPPWAPAISLDEPGAWPDDVRMVLVPCALPETDMSGEDREMGAVLLGAAETFVLTLQGAVERARRGTQSVAVAVITVGGYCTEAAPAATPSAPAPPARGVRADAPARVWAAALAHSAWAAARTAALEVPARVRLSCIDVDPADAPVPSTFGAVLARVVSIPCGDAALEQPFVWALRGAHCFIQRITKLDHAQRPIRAPTEGGEGALRPDGAYIVTGATGALGAHVVKWCLAQGAGHVLCLGRRAALPLHETEALRSSWERLDFAAAASAGVDACAADVIHRLRARTALPLRGIFHVAGVAPDQTVPALTADAFRRAWHPKAFGAMSVHYSVYAWHTRTRTVRATSTSACNVV